jgi:hypothetical protein
MTTINIAKRMQGVCRTTSPSFYNHCLEFGGTPGDKELSFTSTASDED